MRKNTIYKSKIATNGQVVIPKELRDVMGMKPNDLIKFILSTSEDGPAEVRITIDSQEFSSLVGLLHNKK